MPLFLIVLGASSVGAAIALYILRSYPNSYSTKEFDVTVKKAARRGRQRDMDAL